MPSVIVAGAGLAGLAAAVALADAGFEVRVFEARPYLGGRASSYDVPRGDGSTLPIDNCQHILLRCCDNLLDFCRRVGVSDRLEFHREFYWIEPGGRTSRFRAGRLPAPAHFTESFLTLQFLTMSEKVAVGRAMLAILRERRHVEELDGISMAQWLEAQRQPVRAVQRFWRQVLVSAVNEELDRMSAYHGLQVFRLAFLAHKTSYEMGVPVDLLRDLYGTVQKHVGISVERRARVQKFDGSSCQINGEYNTCEYFVSAVPLDAVSDVIDGFAKPPIDVVPITGVHLWFDRPVTYLPHATLLDRSIHWMFNKAGGHHLSLVISSSQRLTGMSKAAVIELCCRELGEFFPLAQHAKLLEAHVVKEMKATISASVGSNVRRPGPATHYSNAFVAGDWTWTGWPSTMEGAVRSGYAAAEHVCRAAGVKRTFVLTGET